MSLEVFDADQNVDHKEASHNRCEQLHHDGKYYKTSMKRADSFWFFVWRYVIRIHKEKPVWITAAITQVAANKLNIKTDVKCDLGSSHCYHVIGPWQSVIL